MRETTVEHPVHALIFDMDDTLAQTAPIWRDAEEHLLSAIGGAWSKGLADRYKGMNAYDVAETVHQVLIPEQTRAECQEILRNRLIHNFQRMGIQEVPGAVSLVQRCHEIGLPMAVASGSPMVAIELTLDALGIRESFRLLISSEQVPTGKPNPDVFVAAAERLAVPPRACLVFEDSLIGAQAAVAAGMRCIVRPSINDPRIHDLTEWTVQDWSDPGIESLLGAAAGS